MADKKDLLLSFKFRVLIDGQEFAFRKVSGLKATVEKFEYREGNSPNYKTKIPGMTTYDDITLEKGIRLTRDDIDLMEWFESTKSVNQFEKFRRDIIIQVLDRNGEIRRSYTLRNAWISDYSISDLDAESSDGLIETLTITYDYFDVFTSIPVA